MRLCIYKTFTMTKFHNDHATSPQHNRIAEIASPSRDTSPTKRSSGTGLKKILGKLKRSASTHLHKEHKSTDFFEQVRKEGRAFEDFWIRSDQLINFHPPSSLCLLHDPDRAILSRWDSRGRLHCEARQWRGSTGPKTCRNGSQEEIKTKPHRRQKQLHPPMTLV